MPPLLNRFFFWIWVGFSILRIGVRDLHHGGGTVCAEDGGTVIFADPGITGKDVCPAVFTAEHRPFGEHGEAVQAGGAAGAYRGICQNAVVKGYVNAVVIPVKGYRLHIDVGVQQIRTADPGGGSTVQNGLGASGQVDTKILNAVLVTAAVRDLSGVDRQCLLQVFRPAAHNGAAVIRHGNTSQ